MNLKELLILVILGGAQTVLFIYLLAKSEPPVDPSFPLFNFSQEEIIISVSISNESGKFKVEQKRSEYWITEPIEKKADELIIKDIMLLLQRQNRIGAQKVTESKLNETGIADSKLSAEIKTSTGRIIRMKGGKESPFERGGAKFVYVTFNDDDYIYQMFKPYFEIFTRDVNYWRSKKIINLYPDTIKKMELSGSKFIRDVTILHRDDLEDWFLDKPFQEVVDDIKLTRIFDFINNLYAKEYLPLESLDLNVPIYHFIFTEYNSEKTSIKLWLYPDQEIKENEKIKLYVQINDSNEISLVESDDYWNLPGGVEDLRYKALYKFKQEEIYKIEVACNKYGEMESIMIEQKVAIGTQNGKEVRYPIWDLVHPKEIIVSRENERLFRKQQQYLETFLRQFISEQIIKFLDRISATTVESTLVNTKQPECRVRFFLRNGTKDFYFKEKSNSAHVFVPVNEQEYEMFVVSLNYVRMLKRLKYNFYVKPIWEFNPDNVSKVEIFKRTVDGHIVKDIFEKNSENIWSVNRKGMRPDEARLEYLLRKKLNTLEPEQVLSDRKEDITRFGLLNPYIIFRVILNDGSTHTLKISERHSHDLYLATTDENELLFVMDNKIVSEIERPLYFKR